MEENKKKKKSKKKIIIVLLVLILVIGVGVGCYFLFFNKSEKSIKANKKEVKSEYEMTGNDLSEFDLAFLKLENQGKNKVYSPLSIKYALEMLSEGSNGNTKEQIDAIIGKYEAKKYTNSRNMSFANALFVRDTFAKTINKEYASKLKTKYNAEVVEDSFATANNINKWVKNKTLGLIDSLYDDVSDYNFVLANALAIDMNWVKNIQADTNHTSDEYSVNFAHEKYSDYVPVIDEDSYGTIQFNNKTIKARGVEFAATLNNYDIVGDLGEENIRKTVGEEYKAWLSKKQCGDDYDYEDVDTYLNHYIKEIDEGYKTEKVSTDFYEYHDGDVKVFAKDLKEYNGTTLQYVGIMPIKEELSSYIQKVKAKDLSSIISNLKEIKLENYAKGKITNIKGSVPVFNYSDNLSLIADLETLGMKDAFEEGKADLSKLTSAKNTFIADATHKATIEFSNEGIKAAAVTSMAGRGSTGCGFDHLYDVPVETIDLTFENPYMYIIRDKSSGEVWFMGSVYTPTINQSTNGEILNK